MTGNSQEVVDDAALQSLRREACLVGDLRIVMVEVLGELHLGLFQQLHVAHTTDDDAQLDGVVGLDLGLVEGGGNIVFSHTAREIGRTLGQRIDLDSDAGSLDLLLHLDIAGTSVEEGLEGVDVPVLLDDDALVGDAGYLQLSCSLREHDVLLPGNRAIGFAIDRLDMHLLLLRQRHLTGIETLQVGHLTVELGETDQRIDLIGQQDRFLFADMLLGGRHLDEEVGTGDSTSCRPYLAVSTLLLLLTSTLTIALGLARDPDLHLVGMDGLAINHNLCRGNGKRALLSGNNGIGIGDGRRTRHVAVDHLIAGLR